MTPLMSLMHDAVGKTCLIGSNVRIMERILERGDLPSKEEIVEHLKHIKKWSNELDNIIDTYYKKAKQEGK